jgi:hypothetical protein
MDSDMTIKERGTYRISDENRVLLRPNIYQIKKNNDPILSILGADILLIEGDTLTVIDSKNYEMFRKIQ